MQSDRVRQEDDGVTVVFASGVRYAGTAAVDDPTGDRGSCGDTVAAAIKTLTDVDSVT